MKIERKIKINRIRNDTIREELKPETILKKIILRHRWYGHVRRMDQSRLVSEEVEKEENGKI